MFSEHRMPGGHMCRPRLEISTEMYGFSLGTGLQQDQNLTPLAKWNSSYSSGEIQPQGNGSRCPEDIEPPTAAIHGDPLATDISNSINPEIAWLDDLYLTAGMTFLKFPLSLPVCNNHIWVLAGLAIFVPLTLPIMHPNSGSSPMLTIYIRLLLA